MTLLNILGISNAYAATAPASGGESLLSMLPIFVIFIALMYFLIIRPQSKRAKQHASLVNNLKKGDEIVTGGGLLGKIIKVSDGFIVLSIAEGVEVTVQKSSIGLTVPKGTIKSV